MPAIPHMSGSLHHGVLERQIGGVAVDELAEPEFEHQQGPEAMGVIRAAVAMLAPQLPQRGATSDSPK